MTKTPEIDSSEIILHVGFPKSLSSWLQKHIFKPPFGFYKLMDPIDIQLILIDPSTFAFKAEQCQNMIAERLKQQEDKSLKAVITSEAISGNMYCGGYNGKELIDRLYQITPNGKVLFIIREQRAFIRSLYKSLIVRGMPFKFQRLLNPIQPRLSPQFDLDFFKYDQRIQYYQQLFGGKNVKVLAYEQFLEQPQQFLSELHQFTKPGLELDQFIKNSPIQARVNGGQTLLNIEIERLRNKIFVKSPFNASGLFVDNDKRWSERVQRSKKNRLPKFLDALFEDQFQQEVLNKTLGEFTDSNNRLAELTGIDLQKYGYET